MRRGEQVIKRDNVNLVGQRAVGKLKAGILADQWGLGAGLRAGGSF